MQHFSQTIVQQCAIFLPYATQEITLSSPLFHATTAPVADFLVEIESTCRQIEQASEASYVAFYSQRLVQQFALLKSAVDKLNLEKKTTSLPVFKSNYRFAKNIAQLPKEKRLAEYHKALRALNEKISWLIEQQYRTQDEQKKALLYQQLLETEYRKQKCLTAIETA